MSVLKQICSYTNRFSKFPVYPLTNSRFAFHTYVPLNRRHKNLRNVERNNIETPYCAPVLPEQFGKVVALDPENVESYCGKIELPKKKRGADKVDGVGSTKVFEPKQKDKSEIYNEEEKSQLKFSYKNIKDLHLLSRIMTNLKNRKYREKKQEIFLEGKRLIKDALSSGLIPKMIYFSRVSDVQDLELPGSVRAYKTSYKELQLWSCNTTCPGVMGIFKLPEGQVIADNKAILPVTVICDNIREPGNLGAILRVAVGVGCKKIILTKGCVDVWDPKVLRGGCGAHFKASLFPNAEWSDIEAEISETEEILIADNRLPVSDQTIENMEEGDDSKDSCEVNASSYDNLPGTDYTSVNYKKYNSIVYIVGGETQGISSSAYQFAMKRHGRKIFIPLSNDLESLNSAVALGIVLYETRRQMMDLSHDLEKKTSSREEAVLRAT